MASLDEIEGDAIEFAVLVLIIIIVIAIYLAWKGINNTPLKWLEQLLRFLEQEFSNFLNWLKNLSLPNLNLSGVGGRFNPSGVGQGTSTAPQLQDPNTLFQIPDQTTYNGGLLPLMWQDITGGGGNATDAGSGVGTSINGSPYYTGGS